MENNTTVYLSICDKAVSAEVGCDFSMPDYQPEIRRLLRVRATVLPPSSYVGAGKAEFSGAVRYDILYSGNDGQLYSASTSENYQFSAPLDKDADVDQSDETPVFCETVTESVTGRVTAPRRLSLRCRLRGRIRVFGRHRLCERIFGQATDGVERLIGESQCAVLTCRGAESLELSDEVVPGGEIRVISSEAAVCVSEAVPCEGGVGCRGDAVLRLLLCREGEGEMPFVTVRRIPFAVTVPVDGADGLSCRAQGQCTDLEAEVTDDGRVLCRLSVTVSAEGQGNVPVMYTSDLYATHRESSAVYTEYVFPVAARCISGNFTQSVYEPLSAFGLAEDCEVLDVCASAAVDDVSCDRGKWVLSGESRIHLLLRSGEEYATHEMSLPFRYETDGEGGEPMLCAADVQMVSGRARVDGGRLGIECEMAVSARICTEGRLTALSEAQIGEAEPVPSETVVAFPARGETVWSLAKRYRVPLATLSRLNTLPESPSAVLETGAPVVVNE